MHAGDNEELPEGTEDCHNDEDADAAEISKAEDDSSDALADEVADRSKDDELDRNDDDHREERREERREDFRHVLLHELLDDSKHRNREDDRKHRLAIVCSCDIEAIDIDGRASCCRRDDARGNQDAAGKQAEQRIGANLLCRAVAKIDRQEVEASLIERRVEECVDAGIGSPEIEHLGTHNDSKGAEQAGCHDQRDHLHHGAGEIVENLVADSLRRQLLLRKVLIEVLVDGAAAGNSHREHRVIDLRHSLADDDLELLACPVDAQDTREALDCVAVDLRLVLEGQAQPCHAVRRGSDVILASYIGKHALSNLLIIDCH